MIVFMLGLNLVFVALGWPLYRGKVKPNSLYGLRVGETMEDERVWYAANAESGRDFIVLGAVGVALAVALWPVLGHSDDAYVLVNIGYITVGALVLCARGIGAARHYKKFFQEEDRTRKEAAHPDEIP